MNCPIIRTQLPLFVYGDLSVAETADVERHVANCANCQNDLATLRQVREALDAPNSPEVAVNPTNTFLASTTSPTRRRWVGRTLACGLAASLLLLAFFNLEVRVDDRQLVVRWGPPDQPIVLPAENNSKPISDTVVALDERVQLLQQLTHALAYDVDQRDRAKADELVRTKSQLEALTRLTSERWVEAQRDVEALYAAQFKSKTTE